MIFYIPKLHNLVKRKNLPPLSFAPLFSEIQKTIKIDDTLGAFSSLRLKSSPRSSLVESVITFEDFLSYIIYTVYSDYPGKLLSVDEGNQIESSDRKSKLLNTIIHSENKEEIIDKLIEEKSRSIFYGNIVDFFIKDRAKLEFRDHFKVELSDPIKKNLAEILARRNIIVHNNGRIDRKYIRETNSSEPLGKKIKIDEQYLKYSIITLQGIAAHAGGQVIKSIYKKPILGKIKYIMNSYENHLKANKANAADA